MKKNSLFKYNLERISSNISSGIIVDPDEHRGSAVMRLKNYFKTRMILSQTESAFLDFKRTSFPNQARDQYDVVLKAYKRKDKVDLMKYLSVPMFNLFKICIKENKELPFQLYNEVLNVNLVQARIYSLHKHALNPSQTWHQVTLKFEVKDNENPSKELSKLTIFERRECDSTDNDWRICHFE